MSAHTAALITVHVLDDNGSDSGGGFTNSLPPCGWNILAASSTIINDLTVKLSLISSVSNSSPVHVFEPLFWTGQLLDNFWLKHQANISGMDEAALFKNHFSWINF